LNCVRGDDRDWLEGGDREELMKGILGFGGV